MKNDDKTQLDESAAHPLFQRVERFRRRSGRVRGDVVVMAHGGGGKAMRDLIDDLIVGELGTAGLTVDEDQARLPLDALRNMGDRLAFTTDTYVVSPLFFPGGDIGALAVNGTVNDLAVSGARPVALSCGLVIEEGLPIETLRRVLRSMRKAADAAGVSVVTGDTKVVPRGAADKLFINTAGIGVIPAGIQISSQGMKPGDVLLVNGYLGDHGASILVARGELALETDVPSDTAALNGLIAELTAKVRIHAMRDVTRGGLAAVLNELALASEVSVVVDAQALPIRPEVHGLSEILGIDPVHLANEGKIAFTVAAEDAEEALRILRAHPHGKDGAIIGRCRETPAGVVTLDTGFGSERILDMLTGEPVPRIC
jgi:hydrogenase expression/formation protein HypE